MPVINNPILIVFKLIIHESKHHAKLPYPGTGAILQIIPGSSIPPFPMR
jgi:hypothetical protein